MTVLVHVHTDREAATAASPRSAPVPLPQAYAELTAWAGGCAIETGHIGALADNECEHERLPSDPTPPCGCWPSEVVKDPPLVLEPPSPAPAKVATQVSTSISTRPDEQLVELEVKRPKPRLQSQPKARRSSSTVSPFVARLMAELDAEVERLRVERARIEALKEAIA